MDNAAAKCCYEPIIRLLPMSAAGDEGAVRNHAILRQKVVGCGESKTHSNGYVLVLD